jgi:phospholipid-translocating ATPase
MAIVKWAQSVGLTLIYRDKTKIKLQYSSITLEYNILEIFPFSSETKRMGILLRDELGQVYFYQKGADSIMSKIVQYNGLIIFK